MNTEKKILIIEDDTDLVAAITKMLESKGFRVAFAYDPEEGYKMLAAENPDLIILDVMFGSRGESKGFNFAWKIRNDKAFSAVPVLMMTAINSEQSFFNFSPETDGDYLPVDAFLDKPVKPEELFQKVEELMKAKNKE